MGPYARGAPGQLSIDDRTQRVAVGSVVSNSMHLQYGVPQSSVLGTRLYCIFAKPISEICRRHKFSHHSYADDTQVYLVMRDNILKIPSHGVSVQIQ
jgi:hypothetical protein